MSMTLNAFFGFDGARLNAEQLGSLQESEKVVKLKEAMSKKVKALKWSAAFDEILEQTGNLLNIDLADIMGLAWDKSEAIAKQLIQSKQKPEETLFLPLAKHAIKSSHKPYVEMVFNKAAIGQIDFEIDLSLQLEGVILKIRNGKILEIQTGNCKGKGKLSCEGVLIAERKLKSLALPACINLMNGDSDA